jgi:hypothetical protein
MRKSLYIQENVFNSIDPESIDSGSLGDYLCEIEKEDDVPVFICTTLRFKDTKLPTLENRVMEHGNTSIRIRICPTGL